eukprot:7163178-Alexandrium_andersonii.AAC.1
MSDANFPIRLIVWDVVHRALLGDPFSEESGPLVARLVARVLSGVPSLHVAIIDDDQGDAVSRNAEAAGVRIRD